jgi:L-ascorbate metabolism protein UlaG (beta-lactamase superfamily)
VVGRQRGLAGEGRRHARRHRPRPRVRGADGAAPISSEELAAELDVAFATNHHGDHFNAPTLAKVAAKPRAAFVLPETCLAGAAAAGIPRERTVVPQPLHPFEIKGVGVKPLHAIHGNQMFTVLTREPADLQKRFRKLAQGEMLLVP